MKVLHLISSGGMYGAEVMLLNLTRSLAGNGCHVAVGVFHNRHNPHFELAERLKSAGVDVQLIQCHGQVDFSALYRIRHFAKVGQFDVIHTHGYKADIYGFLASRLTSIPIMATAHNWTGKSEVPSIYNRLDRLALRWFRRIAAVSDGVAEMLRASGVATQRIVRISNGVDLAPFKSIPGKTANRADKGKVVVGMIGRLVKEKGVHHFLRAVAEVRQSCPDTKFLVIGDGPERESLKKLAHDLGIEATVVFLGHCSDMPAKYASLDICVLPSLLEGMPMTVLEALAAGMPVIATAVGEIPRMVDTDVNGLLVSPGNVAELAAAMKRLICNPTLRLQMGEDGRNKARLFFSAERMAESYIDVYHSILGSGTSVANATFGAM